jgi:Asp-tRNA(Asn)/Glu-tRNA(Gln) amidotransferase A subunit family amidase
LSHSQDLSLRDQAAAVRAGEIDPGELLDATLARIEERNPRLNAIVATFPEESRRMLAEAPRDAPLYGVPVAIKDEFAIPWRAPRNGAEAEALPAGASGAFRLIRDSGAVIVGVSHMHFWGAGTTGHISAYGPVRNPWDTERCAGGSSGGSASAVAGRLVAAAIGKDGGGSIRLPSAYCGITGLKCTNDTFPRDGDVHRHSSVGAHGPMCRDAADARMFGEALLARELPAADGAGLRVGLVRDPYWGDLDPAVESACSDAIAAAGWEVEDVAIDGSRHSLIAEVLIITVESLPELRPEDLAEANPLMSALLKYERFLPAEALVRAQRIRSQLRRSAAALFERVDLLAWPTSPAGAPPVEDPKVERPSGPAPADPANVAQAAVGNLTGIPGINVPVGLDRDGLPIGLTLHAPWRREEVLLDAAEHLERATGRAHVDAAPPLAEASIHR